MGHEFGVSTALENGPTHGPFNVFLRWRCGSLLVSH